MSTLKTTNLKNESSATNNVVLGSDGSVNLDAGTLYVDASGNRVGIGTTSPGTLLHLSASTGPTITFTHQATANTTGKVAFLNGTTVIDAQFNNGNGVIRFSGNDRATEYGRFDTSGRLLVGTSSGSDEKFRAEESTSSNWIAAFRHTSASDPLGIRIHHAGTTINAASNPFLYCHDTSTLRAEIRSNGGLANYSANNVNLSDRNVKKDIAPAAGTWDCLKEWEIVNFRYKDQPDDADLNMGVIAQQVAESCPEVIQVFQEAKEATDDQPAQEERIGVKEQQMMWIAIKALQETQLRIETLEAANAELTARVSALEPG